jgi:CheY-like chemotaxis protein
VGAGSGRATLEELRAGWFDLLILDLDMPDLDGFDVLRIVRHEMPHVRVLVVSGYMQGKLLEAAHCLGADRTLDKIKAPRLLLPITKKLLGEAAEIC